MKHTQHYRQGDILLTRVPSIVATYEVDPGTNRHILAHGELTGHHHLLRGPRVCFFRPGDSVRAGGGFLAVGEKGATLTHQEHGEIAIPAGDYRLTRQREYSPEAIRNVAD